MNSEFEGVQEEPKDRTKWLWLGVIAVVAAMAVALWVTQEPSDSLSWVRAQHILIGANMQDPADRQRALEQAKSIREKILKGASFSDMAREYSNDPGSSSNGGDLGWANPGVYEDSFEKYVWSGPEGEVSEPVRTSFGFHLIKVLERRFSKMDQYQQDVQKRAHEGLSKPQQTPSQPSAGNAAPSTP